MLKTANDALVSPKNHAYLVGIVKCAVLAIQAMNHGLSGYGFLGVLENLENEIGTFASLTGSRKVVALLGTELLVAQFAIPSRLDISTATLAGGDDDWKVIEMTGVLVVARIVFFVTTLIEQLTVMGTVVMVIPKKKLKLNGLIPVTHLTHTNQNNVFCSPTSMSSGPSGSGSKRGAVASATKITSRSTSGFHT